MNWSYNATLVTRVAESFSPGSIIRGNTSNDRVIKNGFLTIVKNPFLMTLSLEVLPRMMDPGEKLSATRVTRVALYDQFIEHWLERGKKRLSEKEMSPQAKAAFESLTDEGFTQ